MEVDRYMEKKGKNKENKKSSKNGIKDASVKSEKMGTTKLR